MASGPAITRPVPIFSRDVAPLLERYCLKCHDHGTAEGAVVLDAINDGPVDAVHRALLLRAANQLRAGTMPPEGEPRPNRDDLETIHSWLDAVLTTDDRVASSVSVRHLTRTEYNNTIRDLIGLDLRPALEFPSDDVGFGFDNVGEVLSTPPVLLEMYLAAAENVIAAAFQRDDVRERLMNPAMDSIPLAFRKYKPPVRSPRDGKAPRTLTAAPDPELERQQHIYDILRAFCDRAFRRPATHDEISRLLGLALSAEKDGEQPEAAIQLALRAALVSPNFLFLQNQSTHGGDSTGDADSLDGFTLASRLSNFLWSSMPDEQLFRVAAQGSLRRPEVLHAQVKRMLRDRKARALAENFASQWLQTRKLDTLTPDPALFPDFDDALKAAMRTETELFFDSIRDKDRSVLALVDSDDTFLNERLAKHYGIAGVSGDWFRRVSVAGTPRGGVITQGSVLAVTSNPNRTSPVKRGKWILENILGTPPPPPPAGVEALKEDVSHRNAGTLRERMERHRTDPACAGCHRSMDPLGFGLENFDAVGAWRTSAGGRPIDSSGQLPGGGAFAGPAELKSALGDRRDVFARCLSEKLLTYALGRGLDRADRRAVDQIVDELGRDGYRFSALILGIVESKPFLSPHEQRGGR